MQHERFHYKTLEDVQAKASELGVYLPFAADTHVLAQPVNVGRVSFHNRMGIAPMEGADSTPEGAPSEYTLRRYCNEAIGGSAVIWFEAISIVEEGRSSRTQLLLTEDTLDAYKRFTAAIKSNRCKNEQKRREIDAAILDGLAPLGAPGGMSAIVRPGGQ